MKSSPLFRSLVLAGIACASFSAAAAQPASYRGNAASAQAAADRVVVITDATRHVNVAAGTTVRFEANGRVFNWTFQNVNASVVPFDLQQIAPAGVLTHAVTVYVADSATYQGG